jgi:hypothetical protein
MAENKSQKYAQMSPNIWPEAGVMSSDGAVAIMPGDSYTRVEGQVKTPDNGKAKEQVELVAAIDQDPAKEWG